MNFNPAHRLNLFPCLVLITLLLSALSINAQPVVSDVTATQRAGTQIVDITYKLSHPLNAACTVSVQASQDDGLSYTPVNATTGDVGKNISPGADKSIVWHASSDWPAQVFPTVKLRVLADDDPASSDFVLIPAGSFMMGSPDEEQERRSDETSHQVSIGKAFYLAKTEVTGALWQEVRDWALANEYELIDKGNPGISNYPATSLSWVSAIKWCNALSQEEGKKPVYYTSPTLEADTIMKSGWDIPYVDWNANGYRLPTEAEWEYACRANSTTPFNLGEMTKTDCSIDPVLDIAAWYCANSPVQYQQVGQKQSNAWNLFDMHGNAAEWCWDGYAAYTTTENIDPRGDDTADRRVFRGGSYETNAAFCRSAVRYSGTPRSTFTYVGFRLARTPTE